MPYLRSPLSVPPSETRDVFSAGCPIWCAGQTQWGETIGGYHSVDDLPSRDLLRAPLSYASLAPVNLTAFIGMSYASGTIRDGQYKIWRGQSKIHVRPDPNRGPKFISLWAVALLWESYRFMTVSY